MASSTGIKCKVCRWESRTGQKVDTSISSEAWAERVDVHRTSITRHLGHSAQEKMPEVAPVHDAGYSYETDSKTGTTAITKRADRIIPLSEWLDDMRADGQNPDDYTHTHGATVWGQQPRDGALVTLYANKFAATLRPVREVDLGPAIEVDIAAALAKLQARKLPQRIPGSGLGPSVAVVLNLADMQLFKSEGGGVEATLQRMYDGLDSAQDYVKRQRAAGHNIDELVLANNGDPFEGIAGNYANQTHMVQGGLRAQMNGTLDVWEAYARELFPQFDKGQFVTVHCNHTQFGRQGGAAKSITGDEDTGSAFLAESLQRILKGRPDFDHVKFTIPHDEMNVYTDIAGVPVGFNHGHKIPGSDANGFEKWLNGQVRGDLRAHAARIWITAHRHHFASWDMGSTFVFQCPSCEGEGASKWLRDSTGKFSRSGLLAMLVGQHERLGWSDVAFL